jgi:hypothetical protein
MAEEKKDNLITETYETGDTDLRIANESYAGAAKMKPVNPQPSTGSTQSSPSANKQENNKK